MKIPKQGILVLTMLLLFCLTLKVPAETGTGADSAASPENIAMPEPQNPEIPKLQLPLPPENMTVETLKTLIFSRQELQEELNVKIHERGIARTQEEISLLTAEINQLTMKIREVESDLTAVAAGVSPNIFSESDNDKFDWREELQSLLAPLVQQLKTMTRRPRQIESLRGEISRQEKQLEMVKQALDNIESLSGKLGTNEVRVRKELDQLQDYWSEKEKLLNDDLRVSGFQLKELENERESVWGTTQSIVRSFFKSRGRNLVLAISAFFFCFFLMRFMYRQVYRYSPIHKAEERTIIIRLSDVISHLLTFSVSTGALICVLYISGDWLLLSFSIIFLVGIAWTAREGIPRFWKQIQLMLNLGTVRENERIVYNGVPWRVVSLNVYVTLENPDLRPSVFKVPIREMIGMISRPFHKDEPWFPARVGEWVILSDGTRGEILNQTPEMVQMGLRGGARKTYQTPDFLGMTPLNISGNFRIKVVFGFDYNLQALITGEIPAKLTDALRKGLAHKGFEHDIVQLKTEVEAAGASSLDLVIIADFDGKVAPFYNALKRMIQHYSIEACTENNWGIPFPQLTVHTQEALRIEGRQDSPGKQRDALC